MTNSLNNKLDPNWVTGFVDGEGCFYCHLDKRKTRKSGWHIQACFQIKLHIKDKDLLLQIRSFFGGVGTIISNINYNFVVYKIYSLDGIIKVIIPHFEKYPLITQKQSDFILFKNIVELVNKGEHLNKEGLIKIVNLKASLNKGLSDKLKTYFPNIIKIERLKVNIPLIIDPCWIAGFFSAEGCFSVAIYKSNTHKIGYGILLQIIFSQHSRDEVLFNNIKKTMGCGIISKRSNQDIVTLKISKFRDIYFKMIPLFKKHGIEGIKAIEYKDFCKVVDLINNKIHLTEEGLEEIRNIKSNMNRSRI
jgi:LAGLIDADG endonuclease